MAGTSRATVNRVLREEEKLGAVALARGRTTVLDDDGLERRCRRGSLAREVVEQRAEQPVEALRARDAHLLARRVQADDLRPDRDHLDARRASGRARRTRGRRGRPTSSGSTPEEPREGRRRSPQEQRESSRGSQGGYERRTSISAPPSRASDFHRARARSSSAAAFELRAIDASVSTPASVRATVRHVLVSTTAGSRGAHRDRRRVGIAARRSSAAARRVGDRRRRRVSGRLERERESVVGAARTARTIAASSARRPPERSTRAVRDGDDCLRVARDRVAAHAAVEAARARTAPPRYAAARTLSERLDRVHAAGRDVARPSARPARRRARTRSDRVPRRHRLGRQREPDRTCGRCRRSPPSAPRRSSRRG